ncbi:MAG TPA: hypothetical protein VF427_12695 [Noviherbaspirillum sp.]
MRQKTGVLEGNLQAVTTAREQMTNELACLKTRLEHSTMELAAARTETGTWRERALQAEQAVTGYQETAKPARTPRKTKATLEKTASKSIACVPDCGSLQLPCHYPVLKCLERQCEKRFGKSRDRGQHAFLPLVIVIQPFARNFVLLQ